MINLHGLPSDYPGKALSINNLTEIEAVLEKFQKDIDQSNFIPFLLLHEYEGLLFSNPQAFSGWFSERVVKRLTEIRKKFETPEHINDSPELAPSKRIKDICDSYNKVLHGRLVALEIGLDRIRLECHHFDRWIRKIEKLQPN